MEKQNTEKNRAYQNSKSSTQELLNIYLIGHKNRACPNSLYIIIIILIILIIIIILILIC